MPTSSGGECDDHGVNVDLRLHLSVRRFRFRLGVRVTTVGNATFAATAAALHGAATFDTLEDILLSRIKAR